MIQKTSWKWTYVSMGAYAAFAFLLAFIPWNSFPTIVDLHGVPLLQKLAECSKYPSRTYFYWHWMILSFPAMLAVLSLATPIRMKKNVPAKAEALIGCLIVFILFGMFAMPLMVWSIFWTDAGWTTGKLDRLLRHSCTSQFSLGISGCFVMLSLCCLAWIAYVATPLAAIKVSRNQR